MPYGSDAIPPPGPQLEIGHWVLLVTRLLRRKLPEVSVELVERGAVRAVWTYPPKPGRVATLRVDRNMWWVDFTDPSTAVPTLSPLWSARHDAFVAQNTAGTLWTFFDFPRRYERERAARKSDGCAPT